MQLSSLKFNLFNFPTVLANVDGKILSFDSQAQKTFAELGVGDSLSFLFKDEDFFQKVSAFDCNIEIHEIHYNDFNRVMIHALGTSFQKILQISFFYECEDVREKGLLTNEHALFESYHKIYNDTKVEEIPLFDYLNHYIGQYRCISGKSYKQFDFSDDKVTVSYEKSLLSALLTGFIYLVNEVNIYDAITILPKEKEKEVELSFSTKIDGKTENIVYQKLENIQKRDFCKFYYLASLLQENEIDYSLKTDGEKAVFSFVLPYKEKRPSYMVCAKSKGRVSEGEIISLFSY